MAGFPCCCKKYTCTDLADTDKMVLVEASIVIAGITDSAGLTSPWSGIAPFDPTTRATGPYSPYYSGANTWWYWRYGSSGLIRYVGVDAPCGVVDGIEKFGIALNFGYQGSGGVCIQNHSWSGGPYLMSDFIGVEHEVSLGAPLVSFHGCGGCTHAGTITAKVTFNKI